MKINKLFLVSFLLLIFLIVILTIYILVFRSYLDNSSDVNITKNTSVPISINNQNTTIDINNTYFSSDNQYQYQYPKNWSFRHGREGKGLYPTEDSNYSNGNYEIITAFVVQTSQLPSVWSKEYNGSGYEVERVLQLNGYEGYYILKQSEKIDQEIYIISNGKLIIQFVFNRHLNLNGSFIDNSEYKEVFKFIVNSLKFK